jgi:transcriptional regulator with XRE-family HTH domain
MDPKQLIGLRIRELRRAGKLSQEALAEKTGISSKYLSSIERGKENPTLDTVINLAGALGVEIHELFNFAHEGKSSKELKASISGMLKGSDEERLKLAEKIIRAIYL